MFLQYDEDKANIKDALKSAKAGLCVSRFLFVFHFTFLLRLVLWDVFASLYYLNMRVYLFQISVELSWTFEDFKIATAESIDSLSVSSINLQVQCLSSVIFTLIFGSKCMILWLLVGVK